MNNDYEDVHNELSEIERKVLKMIELYNRPVTTKEVSCELNIPMPLARKTMQKLMGKGNILLYSSGDGSANYYTPVNSKTGLDTVLAQKYADIAGPLEKQLEEVKQQNQKLEDQIRNIYANVVALMGIFVAVFALILTNVNLIGDITSILNEPCKMLLSIAIYNIPLVVAILVMTLMTKCVLKAISGKKTKEKRKG